MQNTTQPLSVSSSDIDNKLEKNFAGEIKL